MGNEVGFTFRVDDREVVRVAPDNEIVFADDVTISDLRSAVAYLIGKTRPASTSSPLTAATRDGLPEVGGRALTEWTVAEFILACRVALRDEQERPNCDTHLIAILCNAVRLAREQTDMAQSALMAVAPSVGEADEPRRVLYSQYIAVAESLEQTTKECETAKAISAKRKKVLIEIRRLFYEANFTPALKEGCVKSPVSEYVRLLIEHSKKLEAKLDASSTQSSSADNSAYIYATTLKLAVAVVKNEPTIASAVAALENMAKANSPTTSSADIARKIATRLGRYLDYDAVAMSTCADGKTPTAFVASIVESELTATSQERVSEEQIVYNIAQRDAGFRRHLIEQLTAMGDTPDYGELRKLPAATSIETRSTGPLLQKIVEICDAGSAQEFGDADERLRAVRGLIIGEAV